MTLSQKARKVFTLDWIFKGEYPILRILYFAMCSATGLASQDMGLGIALGEGSRLCRWIERSSGSTLVR